MDDTPDQTQTLIDAQQQARADLASPEHRADLRKLADLTNQMLALKAEYDEVQARIDAREAAFQKREQELDAHLAPQSCGLTPVGAVAASVVASIMGDSHEP